MCVWLGHSALFFPQDQATKFPTLVRYEILMICDEAREEMAVYNVNAVIA